MKLGDKVYFRDPMAQNGAPQLGIVVHVWSEDCLNLRVYNANGHSRSESSVLHKAKVQAGSYWQTPEEYEAEVEAAKAASEEPKEAE